MKSKNNLSNHLYLIIFSFVFILSSRSLQAGNHFVAFGASGEPLCIAGSNNPANQKPLCEQTMFDSNIHNLGQSLRGIPQWTHEVSFNGGHRRTEGILRENFPQATSFSASEYQRIINDTTAKIGNGTIKRGESLIILIDTHGAQRSAGQRSHLITAGLGELRDLNTLSGASVVSLDALDDLIKVSNEKGVQLGIVDLSCHSGATMALKKNAPNTCIITSTSPEHYGYVGDMTFGRSFIENLKPGTTLEKAFLAARLKSQEPDYPMISTEEGMSIYLEMQKLLSPFLNYENINEGKLAAQMIEYGENPNCRYENQFQQLMKYIDDVKKISNKTASSKLDLFKDKINLYFKVQQTLRERVLKTGIGQLKKIETFKANVVSNGRTTEVMTRDYKVREIIEGDHQEILENMNLNISKEKSKRPVDLNYLAKLEASKSINQQLVDRKKELLQLFPSLKEGYKQVKQISLDIGKTKQMSSDIAKLEKEIFDDMYSMRQTLNYEDPCRKIKF